MVSSTAVREKLPLPAIAFVWENFGPAHAERCMAVGKRFAGRMSVVGVELAAKSVAYDWMPEGGTNFEKVTLFQSGTMFDIPLFRRVFATLSVLRRAKARHVFLCHYEQAATWLVAVVLRLSGCRVYVMSDSKFDDYQRSLWKELVKTIFYLPYQGALSASARTTDYLRFLGLPPNRIEPAYDARSVMRIRDLAGLAPAPGGVPFAERRFTVIARFLPKKNLKLAIEAYRLYCAGTPSPRPLDLYGSGELETELRQYVESCGLRDKVHFRGFLQTAEICAALGSALALILPSTEEQFGNVVIEALAMGVPVILSENCGARDSLVRTAVNGFVVESDNAEGFAFFMNILSTDKALWLRLSAASERFVWRCDASEFAASVERLVGNPQRAKQKEKTNTADPKRLVNAVATTMMQNRDDHSDEG